MKKNSKVRSKANTVIELTESSLFRFTKLARTTPMGAKDLECIVLPFSKSRTPIAQLSSAGDRRWTQEAITQFQEKLKESEEDKEATFRTGRVNFTSGAVSAFLFIDPMISTFELHSELRKAFEDTLNSFLSGAKTDIRFRLDISHLDPVNAERVLLAFSILTQVVGWKPVAFGHRTNTRPAQRKANKVTAIEVLCDFSESQLQEISRRGQLMGIANSSVRTLADLPANELNPLNYRKHAQDYARSKGLEFEFLTIQDLKKLNAGAFLAVTRADANSQGGIARITYRPKGKKKNTPILALVGKGLCFDTGGYNIKTGSGMLGMHGDMTGSAIALALCGYYAEIQADFEVHAYLALAENLISPTAYKPNEVVTALDGTAIEVVDTDAEGRMVLADTLALVRREKPSLVLDFATLTGAAIRSLDTRRGAVFSHDKDLANLAVQCGDISGERTWTFPIGEDYRKELKSKIADIMQCGPGNNADHIYAATFLSHFIGKETRWVHLDLVPAENKGGLGLVGTDTTGFGIFWAEEFVRRAIS